jgi:hypothetical protein
MPDLDLGTFDGKTIDGVRTKITKAGDSLSKAIVANGENVTHRTGTEVSIVLRGHIGEVAMVPDKDHEDRLVRREEIVTDTITFVDAGLVDDIVEDQKRRNDEHADEVRRKREEKAGVQRLPVTESTEQLDPELEGEGDGE